MTPNVQRMKLLKSATGRRSDMRRREWFLVIFTLLVQMSVGTLVVLIVFQYLTSARIPTEELYSITDSVMDVSLLILALGVIAAIIHLRKPDNAYYSILNIRASWLSRETLIGLTFGLALAALSILHWFQVGSIQLRNILEIITFLSGVTLVYAMAKVYMLRTIPTWNSIFTPLSFFTTTLLLGTLTFGGIWIWHLPAILTTNLNSSLVGTALEWIKTTAAVLVGLQILWTHRSYRKYAPRNDTQDASSNQNLLLYRLVLIFRVALGVIGIAFLYNIIEQLSGEVEYIGLRVIPLIIAFLMLLSSEILGRFMFYLSYKRLGL
jgi:anaerobic dimethyl sulfoxide reductase subunit C (anchor subunit)